MPPEPEAPTLEGAEDALIGAVVGGRYRIDAPLGQGGMGAVYRATHVELNRSVAVKVLMTELVSNETAVDRFLREARICASIGHPNVIDIYDLGRLPDGRPYLVMELLEGRTVGGALLEERRFAPSRVAWLVNEVSAALTAVHRRGVIHRDIKPDNLFLITREDGTEGVKVLDFGLVGLTMPGPGDKRLTRAGAIFGTPGYMAPEAASSAPQDARADLYALAVTTMECLTGALPFEDANPLIVLTKKLGPAIPRLSEVSELRFPAEVEDVVARGMAPVPADRQPSVAAFAEELAAAIAKMEGTVDGASDSGSYPGTPSSQVRLRTVPLDQPMVAEPEPSPARPRPMQAQPSQANVESAKPSRTGLYAALAVVALVAIVAAWALFAASSGDDPQLAGVAGEPAQPNANDGANPVADTAAVPTTEPAAGEQGVAATDPGSAAAKADTDSGVAAPDTTDSQPAQPPTRAESPRPRRHQPTSATAVPAATMESAHANSEAPASDTPSAAVPAATVESAHANSEAPADDTPSAADLTREGTTALAHGRIGEAVADYRLATRISPRYGPAWRALGVALERLGQAREAASAYRRYLTLAPNASDAELVRTRINAL